MSRTAAGVRANDPAEAGTAKTIYILCIIGWIIPVIGQLAGVIVAYISREDAPAWLQTHYRFQIRTFWIGLLYFAISVVTSSIYIGWLLLLLTLIWTIVRCVQGLNLIFAGAPIDDPDTWLWAATSTNNPPPRAEASTGRQRSVKDPAERAVLRDIWLYAGMLFVVGSAITIVFSGFAPFRVWPVFMMLGLVCISGALILHLDTRERWSRARRNGEKPDLTRVFD